MGDLFSIAASGVTAARTALTVTGENIANVDTPGYRRRDTLQTEIVGAEASPLLRGIDQQGVQVTDIRRAFDALVAARARNATGALAAAEATAPHLRNLETRLMTDGGGPLPQIDAFFDAIGALSAVPDSPGLRRVAIEAGRAMTAGIADLALGVEALGQGIAEEQAVGLGAANRILGELADLQGSLAVSKGTGTKNPLLDRRDMLLTDLAGLVDISVTMAEGGLAEVRLGSLPGGPLLLQGARAATLEQGTPGRLIARSWEPDAPPQGRAVTGGTLGGLAVAAASLAEVATQIDTWAGAVARDLNAVHAEALDLAGRPGGALVSLAGWRAEALAANRGASAAVVTVTDAAQLPQGPIALVRDGAAGLWRAMGPDGVELASGAGRLSLPGMVVEIEGAAVDGDRFRLSDTGGWAGHMQWLVDDPSRLALAGATRVDPMPGNTGNAAILVRSDPPAPATVPDLAAMLGSGDPVEFLTPGVIGRLPQGTVAAMLSALPRPATLDFGPVAQVTGLTLEDGTGFAAPAPMLAADFVVMLRTGAIRDAAGRSLTDLGLSLALDEGRLTLSAAEGAALPGATLATDAGLLTGLRVAESAPAATLAVFTREGRQLAGPPLSAAQALALVTEANGFLPGATYGQGGAGDIARLSGRGDAALILGRDAGIAVFTGAGPAPRQPASNVTLDGPGLSGAVELPEGTSAARRAELIGAALPVGVDAETRVELTAPATGRIALRLTGDNLSPRSISADLSAGGLGALAAAVNAEASVTGIRAELSPDAARLVLIHDGGADIGLGGVTHDGGEALGLQRLDPRGASLGGAVALSGAGPDGARIPGVVTLRSAGAFAASEDGVLREAEFDAFLGGAMARQTSAAGAVERLRFEGGLATGLSLAMPDGRQVAFAPDPAFAALTGPEQAKAMLARLRDEAPASRLVGAPVPPPPLGATVRLTLGGDGYALRMTEGGLVVEGPEPDRLSAGFDGAGRLVVETRGGDTDGAALMLATDAGEAGRFGLGLADGPRTEIRGGAPTNLPASFGIELGGARHDITVTGAGVTLPPGFPGTAATDPETGGVILSIDPRAGAVRIPPEAGAADAGFLTLGISARLSGDTLTLSATDARRLDLAALPSGSAQEVRLDGLAGEELLVVMTGPGALRLSGNLAQDTAAAPGPRELRVLDAATGRIGLYDSATGAEIATRTLDAGGSATLGGLSVTLGAGLATGDRFVITPNTLAPSDGRGAERLADLARRDSTTDRGGFAALYSDIMAGLGAQVAAAKQRVVTATTQKESADRAEARLSAVDLDTEAARLLQQQQAYQASAQVLSVARQLFDTLMNVL